LPYTNQTIQIPITIKEQKIKNKKIKFKNRNLRTLNAKNSNLAINRSFHGHDIINRISYHPDVKKRSLHENGYAGMK
jgi:phage pi2 protein 07